MKAFQNSFPRRIVVKIGTNVITRADGLLDLERIKHLVEQLVWLRQQGTDVLLVSSGAVASGRSLLSGHRQSDPVATRQLLSSVGQVRLVNTYSSLMQKHEVLCAQVLVTKEDFRDRTHYLNMESCLNTLLLEGVLPIINENDVVSVTELMFTDNDELAGLVAAMLQVDSLIILSNVDGIYDGPPNIPGSKLIEEISERSVDFSSVVQTEKSAFGRGGMITKASTASKVARLGIEVHIANGRREEVLETLFKGTLAHTRFRPGRRPSKRKSWIAHSEGQTCGSVRINDGAVHALTRSKTATSLLPVGVCEVIGSFRRGDLIRVLDESEQLVGLGKSSYSSDWIKTKLGSRQERPLIHYDYFFPMI